MTDPNKSEEELFARALAVPEGERLRFVEEACGADAELRRRIILLLEADQSARDFMRWPAVPVTLGDQEVPASPVAKGDVSGSRIGRYKLLQKIGEGGCGVVWMADQEVPVRRQIALKIIKLGMDTREVIARFDAERQALAMLDHPNIAKILDAGATDAGRPYFVMELVRGIKITDFCDKNNLSTDQRLGLFSEVCQAVQHAHQKGIIHRDLKPSNILVTLHDGVPVPKVIDFGIAKATSGRLTDHTLFTAFEQFIGTPAYMSPEQAELSGIDIDTRSDIYSLGVLLYELLTGRLPFDPKSLLRAGIDEIRRIIREVEPPKPSTNLSTLGDSDRAHVARVRSTDAQRLSLLLRGDLDWIVMRCLEKNRARRYETPNALAADIARHLRNEPVVARPPSRAYRFERLVRRNRLAFAAIASVAAALVAGFGISTWQAVRATRAEHTAVLERAKAQAERERAEDLLKFMLGDLYTQLDRVGRLDVLDAVADKAMAYFNTLTPSDLDDKTELSRAKALRLVGEVRMSEARYADAEQAYLSAFARASDLAKRRPRDGDVLFERAQAEFGVGLVHWDRAEFGAAGEWLTRYRDTCLLLRVIDPARPEWQLELADSQLNLASLNTVRADFAKARAGFTEELTILDRMALKEPGNLDVLSRIAAAHEWLGNIAERQGDLKEALRQYTAQSEQLESISQADAKTMSRRQTETIALTAVVNVYLVTGNYPAATVALSKAKKLVEALVARDERNVDWRSLSLEVQLAEATLDRRQGEIAEALRIVGDARPQVEAIAGNEPSNREYASLVLLALDLEARLEFIVKNGDAAATAAQALKAADVLSQATGARDDEVGECARALVLAGEIAASSGDPSRARSYWIRSAEMLAPRMTAGRDWRLLDPFARTAAFLGRTAEARAAIEELNQFGYVPIDPWPHLDR